MSTTELSPDVPVHTKVELDALELALLRCTMDRATGAKLIANLSNALLDRPDQVNLTILVQRQPNRDGDMVLRATVEVGVAGRGITATVDDGHLFLDQPVAAADKCKSCNGDISEYTAGSTLCVWCDPDVSTD